MIQGLRFIWLEVADLDRSTRFYRDGLGFRVEEVAPLHGRRMASAEAGDLELALVEQGPTDQPRGGGVCLSIVTQEVDQYAASLRARGIAAGAAVEEPWGGRAALLRDPDGYQLRLVQPRHRMMPDEP
jgi:predicted enzyme related to lactoylglutathione lyase